MNPPLTKLHKLLETVREQYGPVWLFAAVRRSPSFYLWDVLVSASWANKDDLKLMRSIDAVLKRSLTSAEAKGMGRVVFRDVDDPFVFQFFIGIGGMHNRKELHLVEPVPGDESMLEAYVLAADDPHMSAARHTG